MNFLEIIPENSLIKCTNPIETVILNDPISSQPLSKDKQLSDTGNMVGNNESINEMPLDISYLLSVSVAESVTAGALSNTLCSEPGSSRFFLGGIVAYNRETQQNLLNIKFGQDEIKNFANPFTTFIMAKNVTDIFKSRIGISTTGYSLPLLFKDGVEIDVNIPYSCFCLYDSKTGYNKLYKYIHTNYDPNGNQKVQRAQHQSKIAIECKKIFYEYCLKINKYK